MTPVVIADTIYDIKHTDPNLVKGSDTTAGSGDGVTEKRLFLFTCPDGQELVFLPDSELQVYATDNEASPAELGNYVPWRLVHKDSAGMGTLERASGLYVNSKFSADVAQRKKILNKFAVKAKEQLELLMVPDSGKSLKPSTAKWSLTCRRIARQLTA